ncbi:TniB family NTP-binding protein [Flexivirga sp. B27]
MSPSERAAYANSVRTVLRQVPIASPLHDAVRDQLTADLRSALLEPPGARTILAVSAPWGIGKSTLTKDWGATQHREWLGHRVNETRPRWDPDEERNADLVPVIYLTLLSESRSKDLFAQVLNFMGYQISGAERTIALAAVRALSTHGVRLVIIDDAHMLRTASVTGRATLNAVKHLNTELGEVGGCLVLVGANLSDGEALADPQIRTRLAEHDLNPYAIASIDERRDWQRFLKACERALLPYLPGGEPGLFASQHAEYLWLRTQGYVGDTVHLLVDAAHLAITDNTALTLDHLDGVRVSQRAQDGWQEMVRRQRVARTKQQRVG